MKRLIPILLFLSIILAGCQNSNYQRKTISLSGIWEIAEGSMDQIPQNFAHTVPVPGLVDMADPAFEEVGTASNLREAFWYQKKFNLPDKIPSFAFLKIRKAKFSSKIFLNGLEIGEHLPNFTPGYLNITEHLKGNGEENILVIRVGADRSSNPSYIADGWDFEKNLYIPGVYDDVEILLSESPHIQRAQVVPDIVNSKIEVQTVLQNTKEAKTVNIRYTIKERNSGALVASQITEALELKSGEEKTIKTSISLETAHLWSPEDPFLYTLEIDVGTDQFITNFGMRSYYFKDGHAYLNGKKYFMRGSNVTIYRFFEDPERGALPWDKEWVRSLHRKFKGMNWNSLRYCIGFPPDFWYDIADEEGFLIQDEYPLWYLWDQDALIATYIRGRKINEDEELEILSKELKEVQENGTNEEIWLKERDIDHFKERTQGLKDLNTEQLIKEFADWIHERANHASVVLWDAQNETHTPKTAEVIREVRHLDLSNRPWDNGWEEDQEGETYEAHPYYLRGYDFSELAKMTGDPTEHPEGFYNSWRPNPDKKAFIINEYAWLWLNRDGSTTTLTDHVYERFLGENATVEERKNLYINYLSALTEYFRCYRKCAGVLHFCGLGYSRPNHPRGQTSDHFVDIQNLEFEPLFEKYIKGAFSPVGIMLDFWERELPGGNDLKLEAYVINDLYEQWQGEVTLYLKKNGNIIHSKDLRSKVESLGREILEFTVSVPKEPGSYQFVVELKNHKEELVQSIRNFSIQ